MDKRLFLLFALLLTTTATNAQRSRVDFISLMNRAAAPQIFIDNVVLPTEDSTASMSIIFRFDNDFLPYKKITPDLDLRMPDDAGYYTIVRLNAEIFKGSAGSEGDLNQDEVRERPRRRDRDRELNMEDVASRDFWMDTLFTKTFEQTTDKKFYASGSLTTPLDPGIYNYVLQLSLLENTNERTSRRRNVRIAPWDKKPFGEIYLVNAPTDQAGVTKVSLINLGENVLFGKDFYTLIELPSYNAEHTYTVEMSKMRPARKDTTKEKSVFSYEITSDDLLTDIIPTINEGENPALLLRPSDKGYTYALIKIPNSEFENATYNIVVKKNDEDRPVARKFVRSYWPNMPASLYNLDVAINHLKYILDEEQVKQLKQGNDVEKEKKFREFWEKRDPTPNTVYNELMSEYYRRIDYAFKEFGNAGDLNGQESDMGKVYISYGPPDDKNRTFPPNKKVREVWTYGKKKFIFENQNETGFANFVLIATE